MPTCRCGAAMVRVPPSIAPRSALARPAVKFAGIELVEVTGVGYASSIPPAALFPSYFPVPLPSAAAPEPPPRQHRPHLPRTLWPEIAERARYASLRDLATEYGVSHETIRSIVRRMAGCRAAA